jgi:hypothetical protein
MATEVNGVGLAVRSVHHLGLAAWFGRSTQAASSSFRGRALADVLVMVAHGVGSTGLLTRDRRRVQSQQGVRWVALADAALFIAAASLEAYAVCDSR